MIRAGSQPARTTGGDSRQCQRSNTYRAGWWREVSMNRPRENVRWPTTWCTVVVPPGNKNTVEVIAPAPPVLAPSNLIDMPACSTFSANIDRVRSGCCLSRVSPFFRSRSLPSYFYLADIVSDSIFSQKLVFARSFFLSFFFFWAKKSTFACPLNSPVYIFPASRVSGENIRLFTTDRTSRVQVSLCRKFRLGRSKLRRRPCSSPHPSL